MAWSAAVRPGKFIASLACCQLWAELLALLKVSKAVLGCPDKLRWGVLSRRASQQDGESSRMERMGKEGRLDSWGIAENSQGV